jgi:hypothetical protein
MGWAASWEKSRLRVGLKASLRGKTMQQRGCCVRWLGSYRRNFFRYSVARFTGPSDREGDSVGEFRWRLADRVISVVELARLSGSGDGLRREADGTFPGPAGKRLPPCRACRERKADTMSACDVLQSSSVIHTLHPRIDTFASTDRRFCIHAFEFEN